jgi:UDP-glucose 4-epimerase
MRFLVTGGAGFIGSHLTDQLLLEGHQVIVVDNLSTGKLTNLPQHPNLNVIQKNILHCHPEDFPDHLDGIAHLAATSSVPTSWFSPLEAHENNLSATVWVIELCQRLNIPRLVYASSAAVYGKQTQLPIAETHITQPIAPYGWQKLFSEQYACLFAPRIGFSFIGLRLFNVFGPRQLPDSSYSGVISIFVDAMKQGQPITIYGDGQQTRDFVYVVDVANVLRIALLAPLTPGSYTICNIGTGQTISLIELVKLIKTYFPQWTHAIHFELSRPGDIRDSQADISQASKVLGFTPQWSIESGLKQIF